MFDVYVYANKIHSFALCEFTVIHNDTHLLALIETTAPLLVLQRYAYCVLCLISRENERASY